MNQSDVIDPNAMGQKKTASLFTEGGFANEHFATDRLF